MLVGETRDKETAHIAVEAALTGHLVFTTLHTNNAAGAVHAPQRNGHRAVPGFVFDDRRDGAAAGAAPLQALQGSRTSPTTQTCDYIGLPRGSTLYKGRGCDACGGKGVKGRVGIYEVMKMNPELRRWSPKAR